MKIKKYDVNIGRTVTLTIVALAICLLPACQSTPGSEAVANKGGTTLEEMMRITAGPDHAGPISDEQAWKYSKDYDSGNRLIVDAALYGAGSQKLPVLSLSPGKYESGEPLRKIVQLFCPDIKIYDQGGQLTKQQLEQEITNVKQEIFNVENDLPPHPGGAVIPKERKKHYIEGLYQAIDDYEQQLPTAPEALNEASYQLAAVGDGSLQSNMNAYTDDATIYIDFVNWDMDSLFMLKSTLFDRENVGNYELYVMPESLAGDAEFLQTREKIDRYVQDMGINYMSLSSVCKGKGSYSFYYTRTYNGLQETYVDSFIGTTATAVDNGPAIYLWNPEYLHIETLNGAVVMVEWQNRAEITNVDNENVRTKPWNEIQEIFNTQMDYLLTPEPVSNGNNKSVFIEKTDVHISRIELGFAKILMKDSQNDYKLIPVWSFMGYKTSASLPEQEGVSRGAEVCFITINAIDGTAIDRGLMY